MPTMVHAGVDAGADSSTMHDLAAVRDTDSKDADAVIERMRATPAHDPLFGDGGVRPDGWVTHPIYLFRVKTPATPKGRWDLYDTVATTPAAEAVRPRTEAAIALPACLDHAGSSLRRICRDVLVEPDQLRQHAHYLDALARVERLEQPLLNAAHLGLHFVQNLRTRRREA